MDMVGYLNIICVKGQESIIKDKTLLNMNITELISTCNLIISFKQGFIKPCVSNSSFGFSSVCSMFPLSKRGIGILDGIDSVGTGF